MSINGNDDRPRRTLGPFELNKVHCVDALEALPLLPDQSLSGVITDPPYSTPVITSFGRKREKNYGDLSIQSTYLKILANELMRTLDDMGKVLCFCDTDYFAVAHKAFFEWDFMQSVIWDKGQIGMGTCFRRQHEFIFFCAKGSPTLNLWNGITSHSSILRHRPVSSLKRVHGAQKPISLILYLMQAAFGITDIILDPFIGSGTTGVAATLLGRDFLGFDIAPKNVEIANKRIEAARKGVTVQELEAGQGTLF